MGASKAQPVGGSERFAILDALRGWALLGILIANMLVFIGFGLASEEQRATAIGASLDDGSELLIEWLIVGKFYSLFSLLFGIGFALQLGRLQARGEGVALYLRRLAVLFVIGLAHLYLLWLGDIVALYALMGAVLLLFRKASDRTLLLWAVGLWLAAIAWGALIQFTRFDPGEPFYAMAIRGLVAAGLDVGQGPLVFFRDAGFAAQFSSHASEVYLRVGDLLYQLRPAKVLAMFLIGLWVGRHMFYARLDDAAPLLRRVARIGLGLGLPIAFARAVLHMTAGDDHLLRFLEETAYCVSTPVLALGYAAAFALLWRGGPRAWQRWAAPAGQMALTNYLLQTIAQSVLFYGWGFGLMGRFGLVFVLPFALAIFAVQVAFSRWWLSRFRFGPVEWLWRTATYGARQQMRRAPEVTAA